MDKSQVLLNEATTRITEKLLFVESDDRELLKDALFSTPSVQGNSIMLVNENEEESDINLELLFNATLSCSEKISQLFHSQK